MSWLITSGYCRVFFRMSDIKSLWLTDSLGQDGRSGGCMALWTVSSSSSLMSWVALTASPGHGMYTCFLNNYYHCWWRYPFINTASSSAYSNFAENRKWTKRKPQQKEAHSHCLSTREVLIIIRLLTCIPFWSGGILLSLKSRGGGTKKIWSMHLLLLSTAC